MSLFNFSYQNLKGDDRRGRYWSHARCWLRFGQWYDRRFGQIQIEWTVPMGHCGWSVTFGGGDRGADFGFTFAVPFLATIYVTVDDVFKPYLFDAYDFDRGHSRAIGCYFSDWTFRYSLWVGDFASWSRTFPWCRWWRQGSFDFRNLLGKQTYRRWDVGNAIEIQIPMPEGVYAALAQRETARWKRPLWFAKVRDFVDVKIPKGIPFAGKGENSWDCGDDGLFGYGVEGHSIEKAIGHGVESVLASRRKYGHASPEAVAEALSIHHP